MAKKWFVQLKGEYISQEDLDEYEEGEGEPGYELSVVLDGSHGVKSWGWPGDDKIILADTDMQYTKKQFDLLMKYAEKMAEELNG